ncbi:MAG TPA: hypothetical protein VF531_12565 [Bacillota bacterium]
MAEFFLKLFKSPGRDNNYYLGLFLLLLGILSLGVYMLVDFLGIFNGFEPVSFLITFLISGWGFVLLWKSDTDYRFHQAEEKITELEAEIAYLKKMQ